MSTVDRLELQSINNWAAIHRIRESGTPEDTAMEIARIQGLDLPHQPGIYEAPTTGGATCWQVYCPACTYETKHVARTCRFGMWRAPAELVDAAPLLSQLEAALNERPEQDDLDPDLAIPVPHNWTG